MAYEPTTWQTGDVVTAEKMNKLEQGVAQSGSETIILTEVEDSENSRTLLSNTFAEIKTAMLNGKTVLVLSEYEELYFYNQVVGVTKNGTNDYGVYLGGSGSYQCASEDDYPYVYHS